MTERILECDLGNSSLKWRVLSDRHIVTAGVSRYDQINSDWLDHLPANTTARAVCVAGQHRQHQLSGLLQQRNITVRWAQSTARCGGVSSAYREPQKLGVDRWLAIIAAYNQCQSAVLVVDAGSALTVDAVSVSGQHLGGYIIPGKRLMEQALLTHTSGVRFAEINGASLALGKNTAEAVHHGIAAALSGAVLQAVNGLCSSFAGHYHVILTGGDAERVKLLLQQSLPGNDIRYDPDLVLDGLVYSLP